jgi:hypothetical protein
MPNNRPGSILGDINPNEPDKRRGGIDDTAQNDQSPEADEAMVGGSRHDRSHHSGSRDLTEGTSGGTGTEVGGSRNYRTGTGATGTDIGNRPE